MAHGFDSDAAAIADLARRLDHIEDQLSIHAGNATRVHEMVKDEVRSARSAMEDVRSQVERMHRDIIGKHQETAV